MSHPQGVGLETLLALQKVKRQKKEFLWEHPKCAKTLIALIP
jgi:hypothetical protein